MKVDNIFVVYDPTRDEQPALERALSIIGELSAQVHVYACIYSDLDGMTDESESVAGALAARKHLVEAAISPLLQKGVEVSTEVEWDKDWYSAVVRAAQRNGADLVLKSSYRHSAGQRILNKTSDWTLIRQCDCPVLLVKEGDTRDVRKILAAIDIRAERGSYEKLNEQIIGLTQRIIENQGAEVHFINAHKDLSTVPDRNAIVRAVGVDSSRVHVGMGDPDDVIVDNAKSLDVDLVVIGNSARSGLAAAFKSNTAEKILDRLECDLLSMP